MSLVASEQLLFISSRCGGPGGRAGHDAVDILDINREASVATISGPPIVGGPIHLSPDGRLVYIDGNDACHAPMYDHQGCPQRGGVMHVFRVSDRQLLTTVGSQSLNFDFTSVGLGKTILFNQDWSTVVETHSWKQLERVPIFAESGALSRDHRTLYVSLPKQHAVGIIETSSTECEPLSQGLVHQYTADGVTTDGTGGYDLRNIRGATFVPGRVGQAFDFDGSGYLASNPEQSLHDPFWGQGGTIAFWVKPRGDAREQPIIADGWGSRFGLSWRISQTSQGILKVEAKSGNEHLVMQSRTLLDTNSWSHVALTRIGRDVRLYLNAVLESEGIFSGPPVRPSALGFLIGTLPDRSSFFDGMLDELVVDNRRIEDEEIRRLYSAGLRSCSSDHNPQPL